MSADLTFWANLQTVPLQAVANQTVQTVLGTQNCSIKVYCKQINVPDHEPGQIITNPPAYTTVNPVFLDLYVNGYIIIGGVLCLNGVRIVRDTYLGFIGDLVWYDTMAPGGQPPSDPELSGIGSRYLLTYWPFLPGTAGTDYLSF